MANPNVTTHVPPNRHSTISDTLSTSCDSDTTLDYPYDVEHECHIIPIVIEKSKSDKDRDIESGDIKIEESEPRKVYTKTQKAMILSLVAVAGMLSPINTTILYPSLPSIATSLNTTMTTVNLTIAIFMFSIAIFPLMWGTLSDLFGRRYIYLISLSIYILSSLALGFVNTIGGMLVLRVVQAAGGSSVMAVGAGTIADVFRGNERGRAMGFFYLGPLLGPVIGPVVGGCVMDYGGGWRSVFWVLSGVGVVVLVGVWVWLPETNFVNGNAGKETVMDVVGKCNPLKPLRYFRFEVASVTTAYVAIVFGTLYCINLSLDHTLTLPPYNLPPARIGLTFLGCGFGSFLGSVLGGCTGDYLSTRYPTTPSSRLRGSLFGALLYPFGVLSYGLCVHYKTHLALIIASHVIIGFGMTFGYNGIATYLVDVFPGHSARVIAAQNLIRYGAGGVGSMVALPLMEITTNAVLFGVLGAINLVGAGLVVWCVLRAGVWEGRVRRELEGHVNE